MPTLVIAAPHAKPPNHRRPSSSEKRTQSHKAPKLSVPFHAFASSREKFSIARRAPGRMVLGGYYRLTVKANPALPFVLSLSKDGCALSCFDRLSTNGDVCIVLMRILSEFLLLLRHSSFPTPRAISYSRNRSCAKLRTGSLTCWIKSIRRRPPANNRTGFSARLEGHTRRPARGPEVTEIQCFRAKVTENKTARWCKARKGGS